MKKTLTWFFMLLKRTIKNPIFIIVSMITPIIAAGLTYISNNSDIHVNIGIYCYDDSDNGKMLTDNLTKGNKVFRFIETNSPDEMKSLIENGTLSCGYIIPADFNDKSNDKTSSINVLTPKDSSIKLISNEILYSELMVYFAGSYASGQLQDTPELWDYDQAFIHDKLFEYYNYYLKGNETFSFQYNMNTDEIPKTINIYDYITTPIRGLTAVIIFITALCGGFIWDKDMKSGIYRLLKKRYSYLLGFFDIFIPTAISGIIGYATLIITGIAKHSLTEIISMILYVFIAVIFSFVLKTLIKDINIYTGMLPMFIMGSLVFCPVFINMATVLPVSKYIQYLFIPNYYLKLLLL